MWTHCLRNGVQSKLFPYYVDSLPEIFNHMESLVKDSLSGKTIHKEVIPMLPRHFALVNCLG